MQVLRGLELARYNGQNVVGAQKGQIACMFGGLVASAWPLKNTPCDRLHVC